MHIKFHTGPEQAHVDTHANIPGGSTGLRITPLGIFGAGRRALAVLANRTEDTIHRPVGWFIQPGKAWRAGRGVTNRNL